jgi:hypothetical protein
MRHSANFKKLCVHLIVCTAENHKLLEALSMETIY